MTDLRIGFIGLGNVGSQLAGNLLRHGVDLTVRDIDAGRVAPLVARGARAAGSPRELAAAVEVVITCLPSPAVCAAVMEGEDGVLAGMARGALWLEMSTTDHEEVSRLAARVAACGATALDCPVSGGCHRAASGNISIFAGGTRAAFERALPVLAIFRDGARRYGGRELSPNIIRRLEEACGVRVQGEGFPAQLTDSEPKVVGYEVVPRRA